jgi:phosphoribosylaminoimidazole (AIR) synthetase
MEGIAQDALIMNIDDLLCVGATDSFLLPLVEIKI